LDGDGSGNPTRLACDASLAEKVTRVEYCDNRFFAGGRDDRQLNRALLQVENGGAIVSLGKNSLSLAIIRNAASYTGRL
jgi:hypothetical protein